MLLSLKQLYALLALTVLEIIRLPVFLLAATGCVALVTFLPFGLTQTLGETERLVRDSALALQLVGGLFLGGYAACATLRRELRRGAAALALSKPVSPSLFLLAKFAGLLVVVAGFWLALTLTMLLSTRVVHEVYSIDRWAAWPLVLSLPVAFIYAGLHNFRTRRPFASTACAALLVSLLLAFVYAGFHDEQGKWVTFGWGFDWRLAGGTLLNAWALLALTAMALALAVRLDSAPAMTLLWLIFIAGLVSDYVLGRHSADNGWAQVLYGLIPDWQVFWSGDALAAGAAVPWRYLAWSGGYALLYTFGALCFSVAAFRSLDAKA